MRAICNSVTERELWLAERRNGIGASEVAALIGLSPWSSPLKLYAQKLAAPEPEQEQPEWVRWGNRLESAILEEYGARTGRPVNRSGVMCAHDDLPWARATFDAFTALTLGIRNVPLQAKNANEFKADDWAAGPPPYYVAQLQWEMFVAGADHASIACLLGGRRMVWDDVDRDSQLIHRLHTAAEDFWKCLVTGTPPAADGSEATRDALRMLYPKDSGETLLLPASLLEWADSLEQSKADEADARALREEAENRIKAAMGAATVGVLPDGRQFSWRTQTRKEYVVKASESRVFRALKAKEEVA